MGMRKRRRLERTEDWEQLEHLCVDDEQVEYERVRPLAFLRAASLRMAASGLA